MAFEYELPDVGEGVAEGEIVAWHVDVGDHVEEDQVLAEVETDKAVVDLPSPVDGTITELHAEAGDVVAVGSVVVTVDVDGEEPDEVEVEPGEDSGGAGNAAASGGGESGAQADPATDTEEVAVGDDQRVFAPPNVRRLARELGVDITAVDGSGPSGRVTEADVRAAVEPASEPAESGGETGAPTNGAQAEAASQQPAGGQPTQQDDGTTTQAAAEAADRDRTLAAPATRQVARELGVDLDQVPTEKTRDGEAVVEPNDVRAFAEARGAGGAAAGEAAAGGQQAVAAQQETAGQAETVDTSAAGESPRPVRSEPYRGIRRTIGQQMDQSATTIPHVTHHDTAVVDELVETRADLKARAEERGIKLTYTPFVLKAVTAALQEFPVLNTELDEESEEIHYKEYYNIGVATATDAGLMVPVVDDVNRKGLLQLASEANELVEKARNRNISREEMQGGTFTVTNFGAIGGEYATPIINHPETAILGLGGIEQRPVVKDSETTEASLNASGTAASKGEVEAAYTLPLSLSIDHRVIDGAEAAQFTNTVIEYLENPRLLLL